VLSSATSYARSATPPRGSDPQLQRPAQLSGLQPAAASPAQPRTITPITDPRMPAFLLDAQVRTNPRVLPADLDAIDDHTEERIDRTDERFEDRTEERVDEHLEEQLDALLEARLSEHSDTEIAPPAPSRRRAPSEPEIEAYYELDAEPPPLPDPDDDDPIAEMIVSVDDGEARVTEKVIDTTEATVTLVLTEPNQMILDDEPTRIRPITAADGVSVSGTISIPESEAAPDAAQRTRRASEGWDD
jgi:hypothetical protein